MYIDLKWANVNTGPITTNIYRGTAPLDKANLGTPVAVLTNKEVAWRDLNVAAGTTYYYVIEFDDGNGNKVSTRVFTIVANYIRGHGNASVMLGDQNYGFMDYVAPGRLLGVLTSAGFSPTGISDVNFGPAVKFSYNNKVYFSILQQANQVGSTLSVMTPLLNNDVGIPVTIDGFNYILRMAKVLGPSWDGTSKPASQADLDEYYIKFILPQFNYLQNWEGESLGKVNNLSATNTVFGREVVSNTIASRVGRNGAIVWNASTLALTASQYIPFILELVE